MRVEEKGRVMRRNEVEQEESQGENGRKKRKPLLRNVKKQLLSCHNVA